MGLLAWTCIAKVLCLPKKTKAVVKVQPSNPNSSVSFNTAPFDGEKPAHCNSQIEILNYSSAEGNTQFVCQSHKGRPRIINLAKGKLYLVHNTDKGSPQSEDGVQLSKSQVHRRQKSDLLRLKRECACYNT